MTNKDIQLRIGNLKAIQNITNVYQQVAAMRMRKIKDTVVQNRDFFEALSEIYIETQRYYSAHISQGRTYAPKYQHKGNGKSVAVLITANTGLYGSVIRNVFNLFISDQKKADNDLVVVGRLGRNWMKEQNFVKSFKYFDLKDGTDNIDLEIQSMFDYISQYSEILVYHGLFKNIAEQPAGMTVVTEQVKVKEAQAENIGFIFEPTIEKVLESFEEQLVFAFFDQSIYESALAKFGSRMMSLDTATQEAGKALKLMEASSIKLKHKKQNKRQMEAFASMNLWT